MQEISTNYVITKILNSMSRDLSDLQLTKLKNTLWINFSDIVFTKNSYDLATTVEGNDSEKLKYFQATLRIKKLSEGSIKQYIDAAMKLRNHWQKNFADISSMEIEAYLAIKQQENNWKDSTLQNNINYLRNFYGFLKRKELIDKDPMEKIESVKLEKRQKEVFSVIEFEQLREACAGCPRDMALIEILYSSGIRVNELVQLKWKDIDFEHMSFVVKGKGAKDREVLFNDRCKYYLLEYLEERMKIEGRTRYEMMERGLIAAKKRDKVTKDFEACKTVGIRSILNEIADRAAVSSKSNPHKFRRTFATDALNHGMPLETLSKLMGHEKLDTTMIYAKVNNESVTQAYRKTVR